MTSCGINPHLVHEKSDGKVISVSVTADTVIETVDMNNEELEEYMISRARKRASLLLVSQYMYEHAIPMKHYVRLNLSSCLKKPEIGSFSETDNSISCTVTFRLDNCDTYIGEFFRERYGDNIGDATQPY